MRKLPQLSPPASEKMLETRPTGGGTRQALPPTLQPTVRTGAPLLADGNANRVPRWEEKGVTFTLAHEPKQTKGKGLLVFCTHLATGHKGIASAMATEAIPVRATFPKPVSSVTLSLWDPPGRRP